MDKTVNLYDLSTLDAQQKAEECFTPLLHSPNTHIERIVSHGQCTPEGQWYDQDHDEWVMVIQGTATLRYDDKSVVILQQGDHVTLPRHKKHRVEQTSSPCIWLAVHGDFFEEHP